MVIYDDSRFCIVFTFWQSSMVDFYVYQWVTLVFYSLEMYCQMPGVYVVCLVFIVHKAVSCWSNMEWKTMETNSELLDFHRSFSEIVSPWVFRINVNLP